MLKIDGTDIDIRFIEKPAGGHVPIYYGAGEGSLSLASVNAGNSQALFVGGGGINAGFGHALSPTQRIADYAQRHIALANGAAKSGEAFKRYDDDNPDAFSYVYAAKIIDKPGWFEGVSFVDIFAPSRCPHGNPKNAAMLYAAPPHGDNHPKEAEFLDAIAKTGRNIATAVARYNKLAPQQNVPAVEALRLCLYSSVRYNPHGVSLDKIALAIFDGVSAGLASQPSAIKELQLPYAADGDDSDGPLFRAGKAKLGT